MARTIAGRVQMAEQMMQMKVIQNPQQYFQVINTGRIDSMYEGTMDELLLIKKENEELLDGQNPLISPLDKHSEHIQEHKAVLADPDLRNDPNLVKVVMDHIEGHLNMLRTTDPALLNMVGEQALPPLQPTNNNPPGGQPTGGPNVPQPPQASLQSGSNPAAMAPPSPPQGRLPGLPKVPAGALVNPGIQQAAMGNVKG